MKISTKSRYGLRALLDIAENEGDMPVHANEISKRQDISRKYLDGILLKLKNAGLVKSIRGAKGGYRLNKKPFKISILEVVNILDGEVRIVYCTENSHSCNRSTYCASHIFWTELNTLIIEKMNNTTLADLIEKGKLNSDSIKKMYYI